jgi:hypothetical protein
MKRFSIGLAALVIAGSLATPSMSMPAGNAGNTASNGTSVEKVGYREHRRWHRHSHYRHRHHHHGPSIRLRLGDDGYRYRRHRYGHRHDRGVGFDVRVR